MRSFQDAQGTTWQAALLDASYGSIMLIFSPLHGDDNRQYLLDAENLADATRQFAAMEDTELRQLLGRADPWNGGT